MRWEMVLAVALLTIKSACVLAAAPTLDEVVVEARTSSDVGLGILGERPVLETPLSATGYTAAMILDQGARTTSEVLANDPSIRLQAAGDGNYDYFSIRGFSISAAAFALDGLYGVLPWNTLSPEAVETFDVIRGPATTFTGASPFDNPGGAINIHPKRAGDEPLARVTAHYDAGGQAGAHVDTGRRFGADGEWGARVNIAYRDGGIAREDQDERTQLATVGADYRGDRLRVSVDAGYQKMRTDGASFLYYIYPETKVPDAPETDDNTSPEWTFARSRDEYIASRTQFDVNESLMVYIAAGTRDHHSAIVNPYTEIESTEGGMHVYPYQEAYFADTTWSAETGAQWSFATGVVQHELVLSGSGMEFDVGWLGTYSDGFTALPDYASDLYEPSLPPQPDLSNAASDGDVKTQVRNKLKGIALIDTLKFDEGRYQLTLGMRHQNYDIERVYEVENRFYDDSAWSPSVAFLTRIGNAISVYANYMTGLSQGPFAPVGTENQNEAFAPIKTKQYETGVKAQLDKVLATVALFQITQPAGLTDPDTNVFGINGEQRHRGVEATFAGEVTNMARVLGGINYIDAELTDTESSLLNGNQAPGVPKLTANLGGEWDWGFIPGLTLTGRIVHTGKQYVFADNAQSIPDWNRVDAGARYVFTADNKPVTVRTNIINVTGKDYWASAKGSGLTLGNPRSILFSATVDF